MAKKRHSKNKYLGMAKSTMGLGITSMAGMSAMGAMSGMSGMPAAASGIVGTTSAAFGQANVGNLAHIGLNIMPKSKGKKNKYMF